MKIAHLDQPAFSQLRYRFSGPPHNYSIDVEPPEPPRDEIFGNWRAQAEPCFETYCYFLRKLCGVENSPTSLYRVYDWEGDLLYAGVTNQPDLRDSAHMKSKWRWGACVVYSEYFPSRVLAETAEYLVITHERPKINKKAPCVEIGRQQSDYIKRHEGYLCGDVSGWRYAEPRS